MMARAHLFSWVQVLQLYGPWQCQPPLWRLGKKLGGRQGAQDAGVSASMDGGGAPQHVARQAECECLHPLEVGHELTGPVIIHAVAC